MRQRKGELANVTCKASGTPTVQLHWYKSSKRVSTSLKYEEKNTVKKIGNQAHLNSTLKILNLERSDNGTYICQVTNSFGGDTAHFHVIVLGKVDNLCNLWILISFNRSLLHHLFFCIFVSFENSPKLSNGLKNNP